MRTTRLLALIAVAAITFAACGSSASPPAPLSAEPSVDISVSLTIGACDGAGTCYAFGAGNEGTTGQVQVKGNWTTFTTPQDAVGVSDIACWHGGCLVTGYGSSGQLTVWTVTGTKVTTGAAPRVGSIDALDCFASETCAIVGPPPPSSPPASVAAGGVQITTTTDGGLQWTPTGVTGKVPGAPTELSCIDTHTCVLAGTGYETTTTDGGAHWSAATLEPSWHSVVGLTCVAASCTLLSTNHGTTTVFTSSDDGTAWTAAKTPLPTPAASSSCTANGNCAAVPTGGETSLLIDHNGSWSIKAVRYAPAPFTAVGCGPTACVAIEPYGTVTLTP